jgi:predicted DNA binding protein
VARIIPEDTENELMPRAKLRLSVPDAVWIHDISVDHPAVAFQVVATLSSEDNGIALLKVRTADPLPILTEIQERDDITDFDLLWKRDNVTMIQIETTNPLLLFPILKAGVPLQTPFEISDGTAVWVITTSAERLSALGTRLDQAGIEFAIEYVHNEPPDPAEQLLTDRQREVLLAAAAQGYYETPRRITLTELSNSLDIAKATGSDVLHRAEGKILTWFIEEYLSSNAALI